MADNDLDSMGESSDVERGKKLFGIRQATSIKQVHSRFKKLVHKNRMLRKRMSGFERRYSDLAFRQHLMVEKKRIDYVLVHPQPSDIDSKKEKQHELDRSKFVKLLRANGFTIQISHIDQYVYTKLFCPFKRLCHEAERVKFEMPIKDSATFVAMSETWFSRFLDTHFGTDDQDEYISSQFLMNKIDKFEGHENPNTFFRPAVRSFLTHHILSNLNIDELDDNLNPVEQTEAEANSPHKKKDEQAQVKRKGLAYMLMKDNYTDAYVLHEQSARSSVRGDNFLTTSDSIPDELLSSDPRKELDDTWTKPFKFQPLWKIRNYFGESIAFYFAWSGMLCTTLWVPALFGVCVFFYGIYVSATAGATSTTQSNSTSFVDSFNDVFGDFKKSFDNDITPYFGLVICVWGTIFLEIWKRKNAELAYEWDVDQFEANEPDRPTFSGTKKKKDPVTYDFVWYYPFRWQCVKFCFSFSILLMMISLVVISVTAIIIYRVIMNIDYCPGMTAAECIVLTTILSSLLNAISILILTRIYNVLARKLTEWENHRTQTRFHDALIFKLFAFQFVNSYASCFYIAFFRGRFDSVGFLDSDKYVDSCEGSCMTQLSFQVLVLMLVKPFPKFFKDIIIVWVRKMWRKYPNCCRCLRKLPCCATTNQVGDSDIEASAGPSKNIDRHTRHLYFLKHEHLKPTLGDFTLDEYTEKIIQYGFLMLFATSFPLAPLLALATNMFDLRVDAKRLLWWYRRPIAEVAQDIGMWYQILLFVNFCGVVSNAFLIAFTSSWGEKYTTVERLIIVIAFEHIVFALKYVVAYLIPDTPAHVTLAIRREKYQIQKIMEEPRNETDYAHLFPLLEQEDNEEDDDDNGGGESGDSPPVKPDQPQHPFSKASRKHYSGGGQQRIRYSSGNASDLSFGRNSQDETEAAAAPPPPHLDNSIGGNSRVSASDVKPQEKNSWEEVDDAAGDVLVLKASSTARQRQMSGHSVSQC